MATSRQKRRPSGASHTSGAGMGIDSYGGPVIDPTENVLALVDAQAETAEKLRLADQRYQELDSRRLSELAAAETKRLDQLAQQKTTFDLEMARVLRSNMDATSTLLATQLKEVKADLQIELRSLNQFRWETGGRSTGGANVWNYIFAAAGAGAAVAAVAMALLRHV